MHSNVEKVESLHGCPAAQAAQTTHFAQETGVTKSQARKHHSFYFSQLMLAMIALIVAWDVTALSLALPVSRYHFKGHSIVHDYSLLTATSCRLLPKSYKERISSHSGPA